MKKIRVGCESDADPKTKYNAPYQKCNVLSKNYLVTSRKTHPLYKF